MEQHSTAFDISLLIWPGAALALLGVAVLIGCILKVLKARKEGLSDTEMVALMQRMSAWNMAALGLAAIGFALLITGLVLG